MKPKVLREADAWRVYAEWLQQAAALRAEFRDLGLPLPPSLDRAVHEGPAPWKADWGTDSPSGEKT
jgi:hypothetical protein